MRSSRITPWMFRMPERATQHRAACSLFLILAPALYEVPAQAADPALVAAATKEQEVVWYTTQIINQLARPMAAAFEKTYPGITVHYSRANAVDTAIKVLNESRAGKPQADVFDGTTAVEPLVREGYVLSWLPERAGQYPHEYRDPNGHWIATNLYVLTPAFNTTLVPPGDEPRALGDLLDPKWRGQMAWGATESTSAGPGFVGTVLAEMGETGGMAYLQRLRQQRIANLGVSAREVLDQVIGGEYAIALQIFNHHAMISKKKGAPVQWIPMEPATGVLSVVSIVRDAPHPNAAKLFEDFLVSKEGQAVYQAAEYLPADPTVPALDPSLKPEGGHFRANFFSPEEVARSMPKWKQIFDEVFR